MLKFVHLSDLHLVSPGQELHGLRPDERLIACVAHIAREQGDAAFCIVSGDLSHGGDAPAYAAVARILSCLPMPVHLMIGNHDDRDAFRQAFPSTPCDRHGFVQQAIDTPAGRLILLDTHEPGRAEGRLCQRRMEWLDETMAASSGPLFLFMHHPPSGFRCACGRDGAGAGPRPTPLRRPSPSQRRGIMAGMPILRGARHQPSDRAGFQDAGLRARQLRGVRVCGGPGRARERRRSFR